ncbi:methylated-DNA--[protein]-cysteine S-methyltransferase [Amylibacter sp. SFDW26]|uniref:methylated-DNA--[protein]-cysteine S-methyltransferase n=1 Tax=Amylibacter sp. SFDW26 TaxID=2652722 RepID=UPI00126170CC|nr:methylated-DNA--[protein]-cysteine S-methyltransferase [Amylibacter sp. SFDW26]KAB7610479.1 methylated-DNA--[protein]-cysteine S-methyltransferase [Amylibacter sp. SFDW26]
MNCKSFESPLGKIRLIEEGGKITRLRWGLQLVQSDDDDDDQDYGQSDVLDAAVEQLKTYFIGDLTEFDLPISPKGNGFQQDVWRIMQSIPLGETLTYGDVAKKLGAAAQPVGQACGNNPIPIIIPCHRILGANNLGGFSAEGGIEDKVWLLKHEKAAGLLI